MTRDSPGLARPLRGRRATTRRSATFRRDAEYRYHPPDGRSSGGRDRRRWGPEGAASGRDEPGTYAAATAVRRRRARAAGRLTALAHEADACRSSTRRPCRSFRLARRRGPAAIAHPSDRGEAPILWGDGPHDPRRRRRADPARDARRGARRGRLPGGHGRRRPRGAGPVPGAPPGARRAGPHAARAVGDRGLPDHPPGVGCPDPDADREELGARQGPGPGAGRRRLRHEAVQPARAQRADPGAPAADRAGAGRGTDDGLPRRPDGRPRGPPPPPRRRAACR